MRTDVSIMEIDILIMEIGVSYTGSKYVNHENKYCYN